MVALKAHQLEIYLKNLAPAHQSFLVYGTDTGLVSERARTISASLAAANDADGEVITLNDRDLAENPDRLEIELQTIPMFGGKKIVRIANAKRLKPAAIEAMLDAGMEAYLIVEAANLTPSSKLRKIFEKSKHAVTLPCFADGQREINALIDEELAIVNVSITQEARKFLLEHLGADRALTRSELTKLATYAAHLDEISIDDVSAIIGDGAPLTFDNIANAAAAGNSPKALDELQRLNGSGQSTAAVLILLNRHFLRLHKVSAEVTSGKSLDLAVKSLRPPVHFKQKDVFISQCRSWSLLRLNKAIGLIFEATARTRHTNAPTQLITERLILNLCQLARQRG